MDDDIESSLKDSTGARSDDGNNVVSTSSGVGFLVMGGGCGSRAWYTGGTIESCC